MRSSIRRMGAKPLSLALLAILCVGALGVATATGAMFAPPPQKNVAPQTQAVPGSGKGLVIGYATSLEAVPIVHVISERNQGCRRSGRA